MWCSYFTSKYLPEENKNTNSEKYYTPVFTVALFTIAKIWEQTKYPLIDDSLKKVWWIYTQWIITQP